jgi:hypothetical protein
LLPLQHFRGLNATNNNLDKKDVDRRDEKNSHTDLPNQRGAHTENGITSQRQMHARGRIKPAIYVNCESQLIHEKI